MEEKKRREGENEAEREKRREKRIEETEVFNRKEGVGEGREEEKGGMKTERD